MSGGNNISSWSGVIRGSESVSKGRPKSDCPLKISKALVMRFNSAVRATGAEYSRRFLRELDEAPGENNLHYIYYSVLMSLLLVTRV